MSNIKSNERFDEEERRFDVQGKTSLICETPIMQLWYKHNHVMSESTGNSVFAFFDSSVCSAHGEHPCTRSRLYAQLLQEKIGLLNPTGGSFLVVSEFYGIMLELREFDNTLLYHFKQFIISMKGLGKEIEKMDANSDFFKQKLKKFESIGKKDEANDHLKRLLTPEGFHEGDVSQSELKEFSDNFFKQLHIELVSTVKYFCPVTCATDSKPEVLYAKLMLFGSFAAKCNVNFPLCELCNDYGSNGILFTKEMAANPAHIENEFENSFSVTRGFIDGLEEDDFQSSIEQLTDSMLQPRPTWRQTDVKMEYWRDIYMEYSIFTPERKLMDAARSIKKKELVDFVDENLNISSPNFLKFSIHLINKYVNLAVVVSEKIRDMEIIDERHHLGSVKGVLHAIKSDAMAGKPTRDILNDLVKILVKEKLLEGNGAAKKLVDELEKAVSEYDYMTESREGNKIITNLETFRKSP